MFISPFFPSSNSLETTALAISKSMNISSLKMMDAVGGLW
jgi:hypothetical protein